MNFCQSVVVEDIKLRGKTREEAYIYLISKLYNLYLSEVKEDLLDFEFTIPEFFDKDKFKINSELIENKTTRSYIAESDKLEYIFKVILGSFNKRKKKPIGIFTDSNRTNEVELTRAGLLDFGDFFDIKYDTDAEGEVYPDVYSEIEKGADEKSKKKGMKGKVPTTTDQEKPAI
jgi:hypothetical protein